MIWASGCGAPAQPANERAPQAPARATGEVVPRAREPTAKGPGDDQAEPEGSPDAPAEPRDTTVRTVEVNVPGDAPVLAVPGDTPTPIVYLHGKCGDPTAFLAWARVGARFGTILSLRGDIRCKGSARSRWTEDTAKLDRRITKAIGAARSELGLELDAARRIVVGYSQGALRAESLSTRFPARYPQAVLIAGPRAPRPTSLRASESVLFVAGDHDARGHLVEAAQKLEQAGRRARFLELPDARHGEYGSAPETVFSEGLGWLVAAPKGT